ncbi:hypothetical protein BRM22_18695 [Xanthomonas oryzae pv. oryzae]|nr:hypothetical protein BRO16_14020 [Xanthomonas oryzae pv. oryzae]RBA73234.1 hypothetical protein BRN68_08200 [Xanthomonas oryzae pv. oryzae]RBA79505.1 hypothetical protein BRO15_23520 [Xanthomonas oryzae pv. oryzae]RBA90080.1 hypothetical protein BRN79_12975 [Xanthomonas oryzae pv. oryzae]RBA98415.1 hypothetical protein BRN75_10260 [Xanthomonas oryzae pv. oryzae]
MVYQHLIPGSFADAPPRNADLFRQPLAEMIDPRHPLAVLARRCCARRGTTSAGCCGPWCAWA